MTEDEENDEKPESESPANGPSVVKAKSKDYIVSGNKKIRSG